MAYRRSIFLIDRAFQLRFAVYVCGWLIALCFIYPLIIFNTFDFFIRFLSTHGSAIPAQAVETIKSTRQQILWLLILLQACYLVLSFLLSLFISHRIAGPIYKLRQAFDQMRNGETRNEVRFRTKDHFIEAADDYNEMLKTLNATYDANIERLSLSIGNLERVARSVDGESRKTIEESLGILREVREKIPH